MPFLGAIMKFCNQEISKTITAGSSKLGQLMEEMSRLPGEKLKKKSFIALCKFEHRKLDISNTLTARSFEQI